MIHVASVNRSSGNDKIIYLNYFVINIVELISFLNSDGFSIWLHILYTMMIYFLFLTNNRLLSKVIIFISCHG